MDGGGQAKIGIATRMAPSLTGSASALGEDA
jgi:hypothetical protein